MSARKRNRNRPDMLDGVRVLDFSGEMRAYAGRAFADLGADVILVEPPGGARARNAPPIVNVRDRDVSAHFAFMAAGKRSMVVDGDNTGGRHVLEDLVV